MKESNFTVKTRVAPIVFRYMKNTFSYTVQKKAYDEPIHIFNLTQEPIYFIISAMLRKTNKIACSKVQQKLKNYIDIELVVTEYDFYHYGFYIADSEIVKFSKYLQKQVLNNACKTVFMQYIVLNEKAAQKIPKLKLMQNYIAVNNLYPHLNIDCLRKHYQRHFKNQEQPHLHRVEKEKLLKTTQF